MSEKALRWLIYIAGIVCLYTFLSIRILPMFNGLLYEKYIPEYWENTKWGELYYFNMIRHFREQNLPQYRVKYRFTTKNPEVGNADILAFGDSFLDFSRMTTFPEKLSDSLNESVFYARMDRPLQYLAEHNYSNSGKKYLIFETAERFLHDRFYEPQPSTPYLDTRTGIRKNLASFRDDFIFLENTEVLYSMLLSRSYFTTYIYSIIATFKFDLFRQITSQTPIYSLNYNGRPWLFGGLQFGDGPQGYSYRHTEAEINNYCDNIEQLASDLKEKYNLELIFMIIPSKYTIYHNIIGTDDADYGNFMPRMYAELRKRNIPVIDFYDEFMTKRFDKLLYYSTDTHWTEEGLNIALNKTIQVIDSLDNSNSHCDIDHYLVEQ